MLPNKHHPHWIVSNEESELDARKYGRAEQIKILWIVIGCG